MVVEGRVRERIPNASPDTLVHGYGLVYQLLYQVHTNITDGNHGLGPSFTISSRR